MDELDRGAADHLLWIITENGQRARTHPQEVALSVDDEDEVKRGLE